MVYQLIKIWGRGHFQSLCAILYVDLKTSRQALIFLIYGPDNRYELTLDLWADL